MCAPSVPHLFMLYIRVIIRIFYYYQKEALTYFCLVSAIFCAPSLAFEPFGTCRNDTYKKLASKVNQKTIERSVETQRWMIGDL